jgi:hypothetical protein
LGILNHPDAVSRVIGADLDDLAVGIDDVVVVAHREVYWGVAIEQWESVGTLDRRWV